VASVWNLGQMFRRKIVDSIVVIIVESSSSQVRVYFFWKNFCFMVWGGGFGIYLFGLMFGFK
jgi:hypothetical protein